MFRVLRTVNPVNNRHVTCVYNFCRYAGHSKWQNIRHIKAEKDSQRAALYGRLIRLMRVTAIEGNCADPSVNVQLAQAIEQAKRANMPVATINDVIKNLKGKYANIVEEMKTCELSGPGGSAFVIIVSGHFIEVKSKITTILRKSKGAFSLGTIMHMFHCKSIIQTDFPANTTLEDAVNLAVELEMEDVIEINKADQSFLQFTGEFLELNKLKTQFECKNYFVHSAELSYMPVSQVLIKDSDLESVSVLFKKLQALPEVVNIFDNIAWPEDL